MFVVFLTAKAESFSYEPGAPLWSARARSESSLCAASSSGVSATTWGADVSGLQPFRQGGDLGFFDLRWCLDDCAKASNAPPNDKPKMSINATRVRDIYTHKYGILRRATKVSGWRSISDGARAWRTDIRPGRARPLRQEFPPSSDKSNRLGD